MDPSAPSPAVFHVTHWKAGSSWITRVLRRCAGDRYVHPRPESGQFLEDPIRPGGVYTRLFVTREQFEEVSLPPPWRRIVVIRDLRDTLVSAYYSVRFSHQLDPDMERARAQLATLDLERGLEWMLDHIMVAGSAEIQASWYSAGVPLTRFEDLIADDGERLRQLVVEELELDVPPRALDRIMRRTSFEEMSGGRAQGVEDTASHFRKGVAGDWKHRMPESVKTTFKERWGDLLVATGYERDTDW